MSIIGTGPSFLSSIGRHSLRLCGDCIILMHGVHLSPSDAVIVRLELNVHTPPSTTTTLPQDSYWYPPVELPLSQLPELRQLIGRSFLGYSQSVFRGGDDHDVLSGLVTAYVTDCMQGRFSPPENTLAMYQIRAYLSVSPSAPTEAAPALIIRKVTYKINKEAEEEEIKAEDEQVIETSCPICLQDFEEGEEVHLTRCEHPFHLGCLVQWLQRKSDCPLCRTAII